MKVEVRKLPSDFYCIWPTKLNRMILSKVAVNWLASAKQSSRLSLKLQRICHQSSRLSLKLICEPWTVHAPESSEFPQLVYPFIETTIGYSLPFGDTYAPVFQFLRLILQRQKPNPLINIRIQKAFSIPLTTFSDVMSSIQPQQIQGVPSKRRTACPDHYRYIISTRT
jgi:hypothetical protein